MAAPPNIAAARSFIDLLLNGQPPTHEQLARALDELALSYYDTPFGMPGEDDAPEPPDFDRPEPHLGTMFPNFGFYATADPTTPLNEEPLVGDAIDDLLDIIGDLQEVLWRYEQVSADDAHWHFRFLFEIHWGRHLRELSLYLHAKQFS